MKLLKNILNWSRWRNIFILVDEPLHAKIDRSLKQGSMGKLKMLELEIDVTWPSVIKGGGIKKCTKRKMRHGKEWIKEEVWLWGPNVGTWHWQQFVNWRHCSLEQKIKICVTIN